MTGPENSVGEMTREDVRENRHGGWCVGDHDGPCRTGYGTVVMSQAVPELDLPCYTCGRPTNGTYVVWGLSTGELVHVCDDCVADGDDEDEDEPEFTNREGDPAFNGAFG